MANTRSLCLCTLLVATTLMQGCRGQCDGHVKVLVATEESNTFGLPGFFNNPPDECKWLIRAEDGYINIRITMKNIDDDGRSLCLSGVSLYDGATPKMAELINTFCADTDKYFYTSGRNMYVLYHSRTVGWFNFTMEYWAAEKDIPGVISCGGPAPQGVSFIILLLIGLPISSTILCCCYCFCRATKCVPPLPLSSQAPPHSVTPPLCLATSTTISTGGN